MSRLISAILALILGVALCVVLHVAWNGSSASHSRRVEAVETHVLPAAANTQSPTSTLSISTGDGLSLTFSADGQVTGLAMDGEPLAEEARRAPLAWVQRLGYLLCLVEADELAGQLDGIVAERNAFTVALAPWRSMTGARRDARWSVAVNIAVEPDQ